MSLLAKYPGSLAFFLLLVMGGGVATGILTAPGEWYAGLNKPSFNPPNWIFGPAWTVLYVFIAIAGWRVWVQGGDRQAIRLWFIQLGLNFVWSPVFFAAQRPGWALCIISLLLLAILAFIHRTRASHRVSSALFIPYALWVSFALVLNGAIFLLNSPN
jgi:benzodiazapine receptor